MLSGSWWARYMQHKSRLSRAVCSEHLHKVYYTTVLTVTWRSIMENRPRATMLSCIAASGAGLPSDSAEVSHVQEGHSRAALRADGVPEGCRSQDRQGGLWEPRPLPAKAGRICFLLCCTGAVWAVAFEEPSRHQQCMAVHGKVGFVLLHVRAYTPNLKLQTLGQGLRHKHVNHKPFMFCFKLVKTPIAVGSPSSIQSELAEDCEMPYAMCRLIPSESWDGCTWLPATLHQTSLCLE